MTKEVYPNKYNAGDTVYALAHPTQALIVRRYIDQVYYCKVAADLNRKELVYYERELVNTDTTKH